MDKEEALQNVLEDIVQKVKLFGEINGESTQKKELSCSFCGKSQYEVSHLIAGPGVYICEECTELCVEIFVECGAGEGSFKAEDKVFYVGYKDIENGKSFDNVEDYERYLLPIVENVYTLNKKGVEYVEHVNVEEFGVVETVVKVLNGTVVVGYMSGAYRYKIDLLHDVLMYIKVKTPYEIGEIMMDEKPITCLYIKQEEEE